MEENKKETKDDHKKNTLIVKSVLYDCIFEAVDSSQKEELERLKNVYIQ